MGKERKERVVGFGAKSLEAPRVGGGSVPQGFEWTDLDPCVVRWTVPSRLCGFAYFAIALMSKNTFLFSQPRTRLLRGLTMIVDRRRGCGSSGARRLSLLSLSVSLSLSLSLSISSNRWKSTGQSVHVTSRPRDARRPTVIHHARTPPIRWKPCSIDGHAPEPVCSEQATKPTLSHVE